MHKKEDRKNFGLVWVQSFFHHIAAREIWFSFPYLTFLLVAIKLRSMKMLTSHFGGWCLVGWVARLEEKSYKKAKEKYLSKAKRIPIKRQRRNIWARRREILWKGRGEIFEQGEENSYKKVEEKYFSKAKRNPIKRQRRNILARRREILEYKAAKAAQLLLQTECTTIGKPQI